MFGPGDAPASTEKGSRRKSGSWARPRGLSGTRTDSLVRSLEQGGERGETRAALSDGPPPSPAAPLVRPPVIGRDGELALLKQIYDSVLARAEVRVATVGGRAGTGKPRLAGPLVGEPRASRKPRVYHGGARA